MAIFKFPQHLGEKLSRNYQKKLRLAADKAFKIIVPSENTKKDLMRLYKAPEKKIEVIYEGVDSNFEFRIFIQFQSELSPLF